MLQREGYAFDEEAVLRACAETGTAVEMNANPNRLDLDWRSCRRAKELGVRLCIASDAHAAASLLDFRYGVGIARKGWLERGDVINCLEVAGFLEFARAKRGRAPEAPKPRRASAKRAAKKPVLRPSASSGRPEHVEGRSSAAAKGERPRKGAKKARGKKT